MRVDVEIGLERRLVPRLMLLTLDPEDEGEEGGGIGGGGFFGKGEEKDFFL